MHINRRGFGGTGMVGILIMFNNYVNAINDMFLFLFSGNAALGQSPL